MVTVDFSVHSGKNIVHCAVVIYADGAYYLAAILKLLYRYLIISSSHVVISDALDFLTGIALIAKHSHRFRVTYKYRNKNIYSQTSNISRTFVGNIIVDNSDVVVGAASTTSSCST